jgi:hypothetical protein
MKRAKTIMKRLREDTEYQKFFQAAMDRFKINTPADLKDPAKKKEFFDYVDNNYKAKSEITETTRFKKLIREEVRKSLKEWGMNTSYNLSGKEVALSNEILDFLEGRKVIKPNDAQRIHPELASFLKTKI